MNDKAQASLEYLMTYGWALILIATVVGVLVFVVSTPSEGMKCSVDDQTKFILKGIEIPEGGHSSGPGFDYWQGSENKMILQNVTGGKITVTDIQCWSESLAGWFPCLVPLTDRYIMDPVPSDATINGASWPAGSSSIEIPTGSEIGLKGFEIRHSKKTLEERGSRFVDRF